MTFKNRQQAEWWASQINYRHKKPISHDLPPPDLDTSLESEMSGIEAHFQEDSPPSATVKGDTGGTEYNPPKGFILVPEPQEETEDTEQILQEMETETPDS